MFLSKLCEIFKKFFDFSWISGENVFFKRRAEFMYFLFIYCEFYMLVFGLLVGLVIFIFELVRLKIQQMMENRSNTIETA
jgi:hypothetical protein